MSVPTFILAFRTFAAQKSLPKLMMSDNSTTYLAAAEELKKLFESPESEILHRQNIGWQFIPKRAPWFWRILGEVDRFDESIFEKSSRKSVSELGNVTDPRGRDRSHFK